MAGTKKAAWCFTSHDVSPEYQTRLDNLNCKYMVYGREVCPTTNRPHLQGYVEFPSARHFNAVKKLLPGCHLEPRHGTSTEAAAYCKKDGNSVERGEISHPGARTDLVAVREQIAEGASLEHIIDTTTSYQSIKMAITILPIKEPKRNFQPYVEWIHGPTGTGKTHKAHADNPPPARIHIQGDTDTWWQGYDGHDVVIIDDYRRSYCSFVRLLRLLDKYAMLVMVKGGSRQLLARKFYITAPCHPREMFSDIYEDVGQLLRRIDKVTYLGELYVAPLQQPADATDPPNSPSSSQADTEEA